MIQSSRGLKNEREDSIIAGSKQGGLKARDTNKGIYGADYYARLGRLGGMVRSPTKGFGGDRDRARTAGALGGRKSKRGPANKENQ